MAEQGAKEPTVIKKYANRRLYHTGTSSYVTLEDLALMVRQGEDFLVTDAKTGEDITRSVLTQIIFEQENKGQFLLPIAFLRQLIQFYGDNMQALVPRYLEFSLGQFMAAAAQLGGDTWPMEGIEPARYDEILQMGGTGYATVVACAAGYRHPEDKYATTPKVRFKAAEVIERR